MLGSSRAVCWAAVGQSITAAAGQPCEMAEPPPKKRARLHAASPRLSPQLSPRLSLLPSFVLSLDAFAVRLPASLCMVVGLLSRSHRGSLHEVGRGRESSLMPLSHVTRSAAECGEALRLAPSLGLVPSSAVCTAASRAGNVPVLILAQTLGCAMQKRVCYFAAVASDSPEVLRYLEPLSPGVEWNESLCARAATHGALNVLKYLRSDTAGRPGGRCPWDSEACKNAAVNRHRVLLDWMRSPAQTCPWGVDLTACLGARGDLSMLMFVRERAVPCPWDSLTTTLAASNGHWPLVEWARAHDCPCTPDVAILADRHTAADAPYARLVATSTGQT